MSFAQYPRIAWAIFAAFFGSLARKTTQPLECLYQFCVLTSLPVWSPALPPWALPFSSLLALPMMTAMFFSSCPYALVYSTAMTYFLHVHAVPFCTRTAPSLRTFTEHICWALL